MAVEEFTPPPPQRVYMNVSAHVRVRVDVIINQGKPALHISKTFQIKVKMCWLPFDFWPGSKLAVGRGVLGGGAAGLCPCTFC